MMARRDTGRRVAERWRAPVIVAFALGALLGATPTSVLALNPDERLADPALEERARDISKGLRCVVCQNQSIDDSDADLARDMRLLVRERLIEGDTDAEVERYLVQRYGEFVLLKPALGGHTILLWATPALLLLGGALALSRRGRPVRASGRTDALSEREEAALRRALE